MTQMFAVVPGIEKTNRKIPLPEIPGRPLPVAAFRSRLADEVGGVAADMMAVEYVNDAQLVNC